ncbi:MAG: hypothetical protein KKD39_02415, partial [Candidatus Altiarchaeota archaeon]|nr:hypothetical protein [Candidatus Altiarchaeota archaeon]
MRHFFSLLAQNKRLILVFTAACVLVSVGLALLSPKTYEATATIQVGSILQNQRYYYPFTHEEVKNMLISSENVVPILEKYNISKATYHSFASNNIDVKIYSERPISQSAKSTDLIDIKLRGRDP